MKFFKLCIIAAATCAATMLHSCTKDNVKPTKQATQVLMDGGGETPPQLPPPPPIKPGA